MSDMQCKTSLNKQRIDALKFSYSVTEFNITQSVKFVYNIL